MIKKCNFGWSAYHRQNLIIIILIIIIDDDDDYDDNNNTYYYYHQYLYDEKCLQIMAITSTLMQWCVIHALLAIK